MHHFWNLGWSGREVDSPTEVSNIGWKWGVDWFPVDPQTSA